MPVSSLLRSSRAVTRRSPAHDISLHCMCLRALGHTLPSHHTATCLPYCGPLVASPRILRHLSATPNLQIFAKLTSFISKLAVEPDHADRPAEHRHVGKNETSQIDKVHDKLVSGSANSFLAEYDKDLNTIVDTVKPPLANISLTSPAVSSSRKRVYKKREKKENLDKKLRFFHFDKLGRPVVTEHFKGTYEFLQSVGVPCDELQYFPDVQAMTRDEILMCLERLKGYGIHKVFSLFLVQRAHAEIKVGLVPTNPGKMRDGRIPISHLSQVKLYLNLCKMLDRHDLDIIALLDTLVEKNGYETMATVQTKIRKLLSVGASPDDIMNNLDLLCISREKFDKKMSLYRRSRPHANLNFPVQLFLSKSFQTFQERLNVGPKKIELAEMLDVSSEEFQVCWGYKKFSMSDLVQKVRMCLNVGISKKDVFNNLSILNNIPIEKCYEVIHTFQLNGLPASIFILKEMQKVTGNMSRGDSLVTGVASPAWTQGDESGAHSINHDNIQGTSTSALQQQQEDHSVSAGILRTSLNSNESLSSRPVDAPVVDPKPAVKPSPKPKIPKPSTTYNSVESSKRGRRVLFRLVAHLLQLDSAGLSSMFRCSLSVAKVTRLDVTRNLDLLMAGGLGQGPGFSLEELAQCPLVLVHPHADVKAVLKSAPELVAASLSSSSSFTLSSSSNKSELLSSSSTLSAESWDNDQVALDNEEDDINDNTGDDDEALRPHQQTAGPNNSPLSHQNSISDTFSEDSLLQTSFSSLSSPSFALSSSSKSTLEEGSSALSANLSSTANNTTDSTTPTHVTTDPTHLRQVLFSCPKRHLNLLQYLLEKESSFSLGVCGAHLPSGFLNRPL